MHLAVNTTLVLLGTYDEELVPRYLLSKDFAYSTTAQKPVVKLLLKGCGVAIQEGFENLLIHFPRYSSWLAFGDLAVNLCLKS